MSFRFANRTAFSSLVLAGASFGLLACGGGGDAGDNEPLMAGVMLSIEANLTGVGDTAAAGFFAVMQVTGNGTDTPLVTVNAASTSADDLEHKTIFLYRRNGNVATVDGSFNIAAGQTVLPGPIQVAVKEKVSIRGTITYTDDAEYNDSTGAFAGVFRCDVGDADGEGGEGEWDTYVATEGVVTYKVL